MALAAPQHLVDELAERSELTSMRVIDSHTGGQPTRVIIDGAPDLGAGPVATQLKRMSEQFDHIRTGTVLEPKCDDAMVGALLCKPHDRRCSAGVIFFNTAGYLGMCGHGLIGLMATLKHLNMIAPGDHLIETPVGIVSAKLLDDNTAEFVNVESYVAAPNVSIEVSGLGRVEGHVAWGGNWFFLAKDAPFRLQMDNLNQLTDAAWAVRKALRAQGISGNDGQEIDHIEFFESSAQPEVNSRNFVLCPGGAYDRSPCGTGTSAKLACLAFEGKLKPLEPWVQESFIGSRFTAHFVPSETPGRIIPTVKGQAFVFADTRLIFQTDDPFSMGIQ